MKAIFFILGVLCFVIAAFKPWLGSAAKVEWHWLGTAFWGLALWVV